jgi:hypothetical protein
LYFWKFYIQPRIKYFRDHSLLFSHEDWIFTHVWLRTFFIREKSAVRLRWYTFHLFIPFAFALTTQFRESTTLQLNGDLYYLRKRWEELVVDQESETFIGARLGGSWVTWTSNHKIALKSQQQNGYCHNHRLFCACVAHFSFILFSS